MRNEGDVKKAVKELLNKLGVYWFMPVQTGFGVKGIPDFICCHNGRFIGIETKFGGNKTSAWQDIQINKIRAANGKCFVINEKNLTDLPDLITEVEAV